MKRSACFIFILLIFTQKVSAVEKIILFYGNGFPLQSFKIEAKKLANRYSVIFYNIDEKKNATVKINESVKMILAKKRRFNKNDTTEEKYQEAFNYLINTDKLWSPIYIELENGAKNLSKMLQYNIKKVPAIVFSDGDILYGINSLYQAKKIYKKLKANKK